VKYFETLHLFTLRLKVERPIGRCTLK